MVHSFFSIFPIFLLILCGFIAKRYFVKNDIFWSFSDFLVYYLFFPALLVLKISSSELANFSSYGLIIAAIATSLIGVLVFIYKWLVKPDEPLFTSIFQGSIRYNSYIFITGSGALFGSEGIALSGIFIATMIIFTNVISVVIMNQYGSGSNKNFYSTLKKTISNPLIIGALLGLLINILDTPLRLESIHDFMYYLAGAATPLSLMSIGAGLIFSFNQEKKFAIASAIVLKIILLPFIALILALLTGISGVTVSVLIFYCSVPCAGNAYILSRQMGGDSDAIASMITWGTILSIFTIPFFILIKDTLL